MRRRRRHFDIFSISFLDIISCGFGAVVLLVLISNNSQAPVPNIESKAGALLKEVLKAEAVVDRLRTDAQSERNWLAAKQALLDRLRNSVIKKQARLGTLSEETATLKDNLAGLQLVENSLERLKRTSISQDTSKVRDTEVGGIPVDSDYVVFIVDTSGSMKEIWSRVTREIENVIRIHPKIKGFQILNDNGAHILSGYEGRWIPDTPGRRESVISLFRNWQSASNSSPIEGLEIALKRYVNPNNKVSIYIFGDEYSGPSYDPVINALVKLNTSPISGDRMARVHAIGFLSNYSTGRFATLMREVTRRNKGTFVALPR